MSRQSKSRTEQAGSGQTAANTQPVVAAGQSTTASGGAAHKPFIIRTSRPDALQRHDISDEELGMFENPQPADHNTFLTAIGVIIGTAPNALKDVYTSLWMNFGPLDLFMLINFAFFCGASAVAFVTRNAKKENPTAELVKSIRERTNQQLHLVESAGVSNEQRQIP